MLRQKLLCWHWLSTCIILVAININIDCAVIERLAENRVQEKNAVFNDMMYTSAS